MDLSQNSPDMSSIRLASSPCIHAVSCHTYTAQLIPAEQWPEDQQSVVDRFALSSNERVSSWSGVEDLICVYNVQVGMLQHTAECALAVTFLQLRKGTPEGRSPEVCYTFFL